MPTASVPNRECKVILNFMWDIGHTTATEWRLWRQSNYWCSNILITHKPIVVFHVSHVLVHAAVKHDFSESVGGPARHLAQHINSSWQQTLWKSVRNCHGTQGAERKRAFYAQDKRSSGDTNLRSLHNCGNWGMGDGGVQRLRCWEGNMHFCVTTLMLGIGQTSLMEGITAFDIWEMI